MGQRLRDAESALTRFEARLTLLHPGRRLRDAAQRLDEWQSRLVQAQHNDGLRVHARWHYLQSRLLAAQPAAALRATRERTDALQARLTAALQVRLHTQTAALNAAESLLRSLSPLAVLERGYAIVRNAAGEVVRDAATLGPGDKLALRLARGGVDAEVQKTHPPGPAER